MINLNELAINYDIFESIKHGMKNVLEHFAGAGKMIKLGKNVIRRVDYYKVSRYGCYLSWSRCVVMKEFL